MSHVSLCQYLDHADMVDMFNDIQGQETAHSLVYNSSWTNKIWNEFWYLSIWPFTCLWTLMICISFVPLDSSLIISNKSISSLLLSSTSVQELGVDQKCRVSLWVYTNTLVRGYSPPCEYAHWLASIYHSRCRAVWQVDNRSATQNIWHPFAWLLPILSNRSDNSHFHIFRSGQGGEH